MTESTITPTERTALGVARAALEGRASAYGPADAIVFALSSARLLQDPDTAAEAERLQPQECPAGQHRTWWAEADAPGQLPCPWCRIAELEAAAIPATVYRAEHEGIAFGTYASRQAARDHIDALLSSERAGVHRWEPDDDTDPGSAEEAVLVPYEGEWISTGYTVTPVAVAAAYTPKAAN